MLRGGQPQTIWALILMAGVLQGGVFAWQYNILDSCRTERPFALWMKVAVASLPRERVAFVHRCEDRLLFYMEWDPPVTLLTDENALRAFLESDEPGIVISQGRYVTETAASMLPSQPAYAETRYTWESPDVCQKKLKAWLINADLSQIALESQEANRAK
jgi:hypothetical protein